MRTRLIVAVATLIATVVAGAATLTSDRAAGSAVIEQVGHNDLGARGVNASVAVADHCAYVGSRGGGAIAVLDVADPANPRVAAELAAHPRTSARELRIVQSSHVLVVLNMSLETGGGVNTLDFYRWANDCVHPLAVGTYSFGGRLPHEFYLWQDPAQPQRVLLFVAMFFSGGSNGHADLEVVDASDPAAPRFLGRWDGPAALGPAPRLHSISLSNDGRRAYLSAWTAGLLLADTSDYASGRSNPQLRLLTAPADAYRNPPGNVHSTVAVPGRDLVLTTDERYPPPGGLGCPFGSGHLVDVADPAHPRLVSTLRVAENDPQRCAAVAHQTWSTHNATLTPSLALISWYSAGFQVFDISAPGQPVQLAEIRPTGVNPKERDTALGFGATLTWSTPVIHDGLIFVVDQNQGMFIFRYRGPHQDEVQRLGFAEGNSNQTAVLGAIPVATSPALATPAPSSIAVTPAAPLVATAATGGDTRWWRAPWFVVVIVAALVGAVGAPLLLRLRRRRSARRM
ncbi:MAG TPA: hypothetical protein VG266_11310 [Candidatus Dormibacteraeota bacterium]|nr:hypothetical protein [Candidatus Dormibacteraeota bacterium]